MRPLLLVFGMGCTSIKMPGSGEEMQSRAHPIERVVRSGNSGPRVVVIHGYGATPDRIIGLMDGYAGEARLLAPQAPTPALKGWSWFPLSSEVGGADALGPGISTAADDLAAWLMTEGVSPSDPAVVTGFSQGGECFRTPSPYAIRTSSPFRFPSPECSRSTCYRNARHPRPPHRSGRGTATGTCVFPPRSRSEPSTP